jgi:hypothetical protein
MRHPGRVLDTCRVTRLASVGFGGCQPRGNLFNAADAPSVVSSSTAIRTE